MKLPFQFPRLPSGATESLAENLPTLLAAIVIVAVVIGYAFFFLAFVNPALQARNKVASQVADARQAALARGILFASPDSMQAQLNSARATLVAISNVFLTDAQVSAAIKTLYQYADQSQVTISELKTEARAGAITPTPLPTFTPSPIATPTPTATRPPQTGTPTILVSPTATRAPISPTATRPPQATPSLAANDLYRVTTVRLQVKGTANQLIEFVARIKETALKGVIVNNIAIEGDETSALLTLELAMISSATSGGDIAPTLKPQPPAPVATSALSTPIPPTPPKPTATATNTSTLTPTATTSPTPTARPQGIVYIVRAGDTLFSIARRYNTTVEAIMAANHLPNYNIYVGQQLFIPQ